MAYVTVTSDDQFKHLIAVSIGTEDDKGDICEFPRFVLENIEDPDLEDWVQQLMDGKEVRAGGGASAESVLRPMFQNHIVE